MFRPEFPLVEEQPPLPPAFEMFGRAQRPQMSLGIITGASHDRFWFLSPGREELIQFQHDRLLHNWRKVVEGREYPRFERMIEKFERELGGLEDYFSTLSPQTLAINQCEITYVNHIPYEDAGHCPADQWIRFLRFEEARPVEDFSTTFRRVLHDPEGRPSGRLICEAATAIAAGKRVIRLNLTARGAPARPDIPAALDFLRGGREVVVRSFAEMTTESAHRVWERTQ